MASGRLFLPGWMPARDSNGDPIPNVSVSFYQNGTDILASVYADDGLFVPLPNPVYANSSGRFPQIYASDAITYSASVDAPYGPAGQPFTFDDLQVSQAADVAAANLAQGAAEDAEAALVAVQEAIDTATQVGGGSAALAGALAGTAAANAVVDRFREPAGGVTYYVRKDGSNSNNGLANTSAGAFLTIQRAINAAYAIDAKGDVVQIRINDGTYNEGLNIFGRLVGAFDNANQPFRIIGNEANPQNVVINPANADAVRVGDKATVLLAGVTIGTTGSGNGLFTSNYAFLFFRNIRFAACAGETIAATSYSFVQSIGNTEVVGASISFVHATNKATVVFSGRQLTFTGSPSFSTYLWGVNDATVGLDSATIIGKAGGGITVHVNGTLNVSSCTGVWTGNQALRVNSGGLIIAEDKTVLKRFYVRSDGDNQNSGFDNTADGALFSIQEAVNRLADMPYDLVGQEAGSVYDWTIYVQAGTFTDDVILLDTRFSKVTIEGASPSTTIMGTYVTRAVRTNWVVKGQRLGSAGKFALYALEGAQLGFNNVAFAPSSYFGVCDSGGRLYSQGAPFTIAGASSGAFLARSGGSIDLSGSAVTITGSPALGTFAFAQQRAFINVVGMTFTGTATGTRYDVRSNAVIESNGAGATFLPGSAAGSTSTGGQYV